MRREINTIRKVYMEHKIWVVLNFSLKEIKSRNEMLDSFKSDEEKEF